MSNAMKCTFSKIAGIHFVFITELKKDALFKMILKYYKTYHLVYAWATYSLLKLPRKDYFNFWIIDSVYLLNICIIIMNNERPHLLHSQQLPKEALTWDYISLTLNKQPVCPALVKSILMTAIKHVSLGKYRRLPIGMIASQSFLWEEQGRHEHSFGLLISTRHSLVLWNCFEHLSYQSSRVQYWEKHI